MTKTFLLFLSMALIGQAHAGRFEEFKDSPEGKVPSWLKSSSKRLPDSFTAMSIGRGKKLPGKKVAIYKGGGVWDLGVDHTKKMLTEMNISYVSLSARDIKSGKLDVKKYDMLVMPGGKSWIYLDDLEEAGAQAIRNFVDQGGGYFGTCAGAFFATSRRKDSARNDIPYGIGLLEGTAYDGTSLGTYPFVSGTLTISYRLQSQAPNFKVLLLGGPALLYTPEEAAKKNIQELATFPHFNKPAMITFNYGQGRVMLAGPHGEVDEEKLDSVPKSWEDPDSEWPILKQVISWLRHEGPHPTVR